MQMRMVYSSSHWYARKCELHFASSELFTDMMSTIMVDLRHLGILRLWRRNIVSYLSKKEASSSGFVFLNLGSISPFFYGMFICLQNFNIFFGSDVTLHLYRYKNWQFAGETRTKSQLSIY